MDWLNQLKANSVKKSIPGLIIFVAAAVVLVVLTKCYGVFGMLAPKTLADLTPETMDGAFVEDDIYFFYTPYLEIESYRNNRKVGTTGMQYIVDFDEEVYYMGLYVHAGRLDEAEEMMDACDKAWDGEIDPYDIPVFHVKGMIRAMDSDDLRYYRDAIRGVEDEDVFLPYYLEVDYVHKIPIWGCFGILAAAVFLLWVGIWPMVKAYSGGYQKQVRAKLEEGGNLEFEAERAGRFYDSTPEVSGVRMGHEYVFFQNGAESVLLRPWDVAWAYQTTTQHRTNGIPSGKTYAAVLRTMDGKQYTLGMTEAKVKELLEAIVTALPGTVVGYNKDIEQTYKKNRDAFRQRWAEKRNPVGQDNGTV